ncbi:MAG: ABC transporter ATP-binding protein [Deinococcales bacterium]
MPTGVPQGTAASRPSEQPALHVEGLTKRFGDVLAVDDLTLDVPRGVVFGFLGPNGAGKTTTIGMLLGLVHPTRGRVEVLGRSVTPGDPRALRRVGALVGAPALIPSFSARRNLELLAGLVPGHDGRVTIDAVLERVGLSEVARRRAGTFSTGMKQRLGLAMALLEQPELLVLDEPTSGMDAAGRREVKNLLRSVAARGATVFLSSHLLHEVEQVCDEVAVLDHGHLVTAGPVGTLLPNVTSVRVRLDDAGAAARRLAELEGVTRIAENGAYLEVEGVDPQRLVAFLVGVGHVPSEVSSGRPDLETLFLELTAPAGESMPPSEVAA